MSRLGSMIVPGDCEVGGTLVPKRITMPAASVPDTAIPPGANIDPTKLGQQYRVQHRQGESDSTVVSETVFFHLARNDETVVDLRGGVIDANVGAATVVVDLLKNGATILTAPLSLSSSQADRETLAAAIASASLIAGDVLELDVVATAGGGTLGKGLFIVATIRGKP